MKRFIMILGFLLIAMFAVAEVSLTSSIGFGAVYDIPDAEPYWGIQPSATLKIGPDSLIGQFEVGTYDVADDATVGTMSFLTGTDFAAIMFNETQMNVKLEYIMKDLPGFTLDTTVWLNDFLDKIGYTFATSATLEIAPFTFVLNPSFGQTLTPTVQAFVLANTASITVKPVAPLSLTAKFVQTDITKLGVLKVYGSLSF